MTTGTKAIKATRPPLTRRLARTLVEHTGVVLAVMIVFTGILGYFMVTRLSLRIVLEEMIPPTHPYTQIYREYAPLFGGANTTLIEVRSTAGNIYEPEFLKRFKAISEEILFYPDTERFLTQSLAAKQVKAVVGGAGAITIDSIMWPEPPSDPKGLEDLRRRAKELYGGFLVSFDDQAAAIVADFKADMDFAKFYRFFEDLRAKEEREGGLTIHAAGRPLLLGAIYAAVPRMIAIFAVTFLIILAVVYAYFGSLLGVMIPVIKAAMTTIWGLGFISLAGYNVNPLMLLLPFFVFATILSHSIQITTRFYEEYKKSHDFKGALEETIVALLKPSFTAVFTDAMGFTVLYLAEIPTIQILSILCTVWLLSITLAVTFSAASFFYIPVAESLTARGEPLLRRLSVFIGGIGLHSPGRVLLMSLVIGALSMVAALKVETGDPYPGSFILWPQSRYNQDVAEINQRFHFLGTDSMQFYIDGPELTMAQPAVLRAIEAAEREVWEHVPEVSGSRSLVPILRKINSVLYEGDPSYEYIPSGRDAVGMALYLFRSRGTPKEFSVFTDTDWQRGAVTLFLSDHRYGTLERTIDTLGSVFSRFAHDPDLEEVSFVFPGGQTALIQATNKVIELSEYQTLAAILVVIMGSLYISYRSIAGCLLLGFVLLASQAVAQAYMYLMGIGMNLATLPVAAVGIGRGVDYGIYVIDRIREEFRHSGEIVYAVKRALETSGGAVVLTCLTMVLPLAPWNLLSGLKFQAEMGILLAVVLLFNMLGAVTVIPAALAYFRPRSILGFAAGEGREREHASVSETRPEQAAVS